jgi:hypothetical protein
LLFEDFLELLRPLARLFGVRLGARRRERGGGGEALSPAKPRTPGYLEGFARLGDALGFRFSADTLDEEACVGAAGAAGARACAAAGSSWAAGPAA